MWKFVLKRLLMLIPVLIGVTLLVFLILNMAPGDPAKVILGEQATPEQIAELREQMGLNDPVLVQYGRYIVKLVQGDMGDSYKTKGPVSEEVFNRFPNTIQLTVAAMLIAIVVAIPLGVIAAVKQNRAKAGSAASCCRPLRWALTTWHPSREPQDRRCWRRSVRITSVQCAPRAWHTV